MNTVQQPASEVASTLLTPKKYYQRVGGLRAFSYSLVNFATPLAATALLALSGVETVIAIDLATFALAFLALLCFIKIPESQQDEKKEPLLRAAKLGLDYLREHCGVLDLILFLAAINFTASMFDSALPAMLLPREGGGELALGAVNTAAGLAMLAGSAAVTLLPAPKSRVRVICNALLLSMSTENFILAFGRSVPVWCIGSVLGWAAIPLMNANMDTLFRGYIPVEIQGRVYSARNTLQFFTIPLGYLAGGALVDYVFEPLMAAQNTGSLLTRVFGAGKGSGAALLFLILGFIGMATCLAFRRDRNIWAMEEPTAGQK